MKISIPRTALLRLIFICVCFFTISYSFGAETIYQHNFDNLSSTPSKTQLNTPQKIFSELPSSWSTTSAFVSRSDGNGGRALAAGGASPSFQLLLTIPKCKKLKITSISSRIKVPDGSAPTNAYLLVAGKVYDSKTILGNAFVEVNANIPDVDFPDQIGIRISTITGGSTDLPAIDNFTIYGDVPDRTFNPKSLNYIPVQEQTQRCESETYFGY